MKIKYIIVDRDDELRFTLSQMLQVYRNFHECEVMSSLMEAVEYLNSEKVDVVFINRAEGDPMRTGDASFMCSYWKKQYPDLQTVLYGEESMAYQALFHGAADYVALPFHAEHIQRVVDSIEARMDLLLYKYQAQNRIIMVHSRDGYKLVETNDILFIERMNRKNRMVTASGRELFLVGYTMDELEELLRDCGFYRCYQSFIVNLEKVTAINVDSEKKIYSLDFSGYDGQALISREKYSEVMKLLREKYTKVQL